MIGKNNTISMQLFRLQQNRVLHLWLGTLDLTLHFQHLIFPIGQPRIRSLNFIKNFLPSASVKLSIFDHLYSHVAKTLNVCQKDNIAFD